MALLKKDGEFEHLPGSRAGQRWGQLIGDCLRARSPVGGGQPWSPAGSSAPPRYPSGGRTGCQGAGTPPDNDVDDDGDDDDNDDDGYVDGEDDDNIDDGAEMLELHRHVLLVARLPGDIHRADAFLAAFATHLQLSCWKLVFPRNLVS